MASFLSRLTVHERASEAMVGVLVALAARGSTLISTQHATSSTNLALISLAATLAWGLVDAFFALLAAKGARLRWAHMTDDARDSAERGHEWADEALNHTLLRNLEEPAMRRIRAQAVKEAANAKPVSPRLTSDDWLTGLAVFTVVGLAGLPPIIPLVLVADIEVAAYASYGVALALMAALGAYWGPAHGLGRVRAAFAFLALGVVLTTLVLLFGG